jgi:hypothetical protein
MTVLPTGHAETAASMLEKIGREAAPVAPEFRVEVMRTSPF